MVKKLLMSLFTVFAALVIMFFIIQSMPGDPVDLMATTIQKQQNLQYDIAYIRAKAILNYDPDIPMGQRFLNYITGIVTGNLGTSMTYQRDVISIVGGALPWTFLIVSISLLLSFAVGVLLGIYIAWTRSRILNSVLIGYQSIFGAIPNRPFPPAGVCGPWLFGNLSLFGAVPNYVIGYLMLFLFSVTLAWFPSRGAYSTSVTPGFNGEFILDVLHHAFLPVLTYFVTTVAGWIMSMKANSLSVLGEDYITYAQVRGLPKRRILITYLSKNALLPLITSLAVSFGLLFGGSPLIEGMFLWPGVGCCLSRAIAARDYPLMQGMFFIIIIMVVISSFAAELLYKYLNPHLRDS